MALPDEGQAHGALPGVVGDGIGHQCHPALPGHLLHHLGLTDARRAHQQDRPLPDGRNGVFAQGILGKVGLDGVFDFFFGAFDVHNSFPLVSGVVQVTVQVVLFGQRVGKSAGRAGAPVNSSSSSTTFIAQGGTLASSNRSPKNRKAVS